MNVGVISATHDPSVGVEPPPEVPIAFQGVNVFLHEGDIYLPACLDCLGAIAPVYTVQTCADAHFKEDHRVVNQTRVLHLEGHARGRPAPAEGNVILTFGFR